MSKHHKISVCLHLTLPSLKDYIFYRLGRTVGGSPWITILVSLIVCAACMVGFLRFEQESRGEKLWVPQDSKAQDDKKWVEEMFPEESSQVNFILEKSNVLTAAVMKQVGVIPSIYQSCNRQKTCTTEI